MILTIDRGNTHTKVALFREGSILPTTIECREAGEAGEAAYRLWKSSGGEQPMRGICCSVGHDDGEPLRSLLQRGGDWIELTATTPLPIEIDYGTPGTLGLDRIAAACGAHSLYPGEGVMIAYAGTALTLDLLDGRGGRGVFIGGNISPGLRLRGESLHRHTGRLPLVDMREERAAHLIGENTRDAIRTGVYLGITGEIETCWQLSKARYGAGRLLLTGGDSGRIAGYASKLRQAPGAESEAESACRLLADAETETNLVALGLKSIYEYNRQQ